MWLQAQRLDQAAPFGDGPAATRAAVEHLGAVQIDTINVIERCHHQILYTRIPAYRRADLHRAQAIDKTVFEYWAHALSYLPARDLRFYVRAMREDWQARSAWFGVVEKADLRKVLGRIRKNGALTIRDIDDDVLVEKDHEWASRKPSKRALQLLFYRGVLTVSRRSGMLKTYELMSRHFGWERLPRPASERDTLDYLLDRALRSQGVVSLASACYPDARRKPAMLRLIEAKVRRGELVPVELDGAEGPLHWARPEALEGTPELAEERVHILSPFDPLVHPRKRLRLFFGYEHRFEATSPRRSGASAISPSRCSPATSSPPSSISRPIASGASCWCGNGLGSPIGCAVCASGKSKKRCTASSASSSRPRRWMATLWIVRQLPKQL